VLSAVTNRLTGKGHRHAYSGAYWQVGARLGVAVLRTHATEVCDDDTQLATTLLLQLNTNASLVMQHHSLTTALHYNSAV